jgi:Glycosyltransferase 61
MAEIKMMMSQVTPPVTQTTTCSKKFISHPGLLVCISILVIVMTCLLWVDDSYRKINEFLWIMNNNKISTTSSSSLVNVKMKLKNDYHVFHNVCLESTGFRQWNILSSTPSAEDVIKLRNFIGGSEVFATETFHIVEVDNLTKNMTRINNESSALQIQKGTYMIIFNTHANNYHVINDLLLPVFRLYQKTDLTGLLIPEGCVDCWAKRLPIQSLGMDMMNLTVLYPMEELVSNTTSPMCFDRLMIQKFDQNPYHMRQGRFSYFWQPEVFFGFRDIMHAFVRKMVQFEEISEYNKKNGSNHLTETDITIQEEGSNLKRIVISGNSTKPVLSWMSRSSNENCENRCIVNERDAIAELSKKFHVNFLDFSTGLTTMQAMQYIQKTDVLVGLHGAGLAYTAFLPDGALLVELQGEYSNRMFINMASSINIPYYAMALQSCIGPGTNDVFMLPSTSLYTMAEEIYNAYQYERHKLADEGPTMTSGQCEFPHPVEPCGHLSSTEKSRCYLQQLESGENASWFQCAWHTVC